MPRKVDSYGHIERAPIPASVSNPVPDYVVVEPEIAVVRQPDDGARPIGREITDIAGGAALMGLAIVTVVAVAAGIATMASVAVMAGPFILARRLSDSANQPQVRQRIEILPVVPVAGIPRWESPSNLSAIRH
jgi:hypothetical protein